MLKFRTVVKNTEELQKSLEHFNEANGPVFKIENDPRIAQVGALIAPASTSCRSSSASYGAT